MTVRSGRASPWPTTTATPWSLLQITDNGLAMRIPPTVWWPWPGVSVTTCRLPSMLSLFQAAWRAAPSNFPGVLPAWKPHRSVSKRTSTAGPGRCPSLAEAEGVFTARDDAAALYGGGPCVTTCAWTSILLESRTVELPNLAAASLDVIAPNPFNPSVEIAYTVARGAGGVDLAIYDLLGRRVATLVNGRPGPGRHVAEWRGLDEVAGRCPRESTWSGWRRSNGWNRGRSRSCVDFDGCALEIVSEWLNSFICQNTGPPGARFFLV